MRLSVNSASKRQVIDITDVISERVPQEADGLAMVTVLHTTAALTTADLDTGTDLDLLDALERLLPPRKWRHPHNPSHAPDHLLASIIGPSVGIPVENGKLVLGTWQRIVLVELDGPRTRAVSLVVTAAL